MTIDAGLIAARLMHYAALTILLGAAFFPFYAFEKSADAAMGPGLARRWLIGFGVVALASGAAWFALAAASMQGDIAGATDLATLSSAVNDTSFGGVWIVRIALVAILIAIVVLRAERGATTAGFLELVVAAAALASIALTGHTQMQEGVAQGTHVVADAAHLLAAGAWIGGLFCLLLLLRAAKGGEVTEGTAAEALRRFSPVGYIAVATLAASGTINGCYLIGSLSALYETFYGRLLLAKLVLFGLMLALAAGNRFLLVPRLAGGSDRNATLALLARRVAFEQFAALGILAIVAILGMSEPPI